MLQVTRLAEYLNGKGVNAASINFPNRTTAVGSLINSYLQSGQELGTRHPWRLSVSGMPMISAPRQGEARCCSPCALTSAIPEREMAGCYRHRALWSEDALRSLAVRP